MRMGRDIMQEFLGAVPGIDEAMSYAEVMKYVLNISFYKNYFINTTK